MKTNWIGIESQNKVINIDHVIFYGKIELKDTRIINAVSFNVQGKDGHAVTLPITQSEFEKIDFMVKKTFGIY